MFAGERELCINYAENGVASCTTSIRKYITKAKKLAESRPDEVNLITNEDGSVYLTFPADWIKFPSPKKQISEENKAKMAERLKEARMKK